MSLQDVLISIESGKHGAHLQLVKDLDPEFGYPGKTDWFVRYRPGDTATSHGRENIDWWPRKSLRAVFSTGQENRGKDYTITPLWPLFTSMFDAGQLRAPAALWAKPATYHQMDLVEPGEGGHGRRPTQLKRPFRLYTAMLGHEGDQAKFPWGQHQEMERFFDPVQSILNREDTGNSNKHLHSSISIGYSFNPYLQAALEAAPPRWTDDSCPAFQTPSKQ